MRRSCTMSKKLEISIFGAMIFGVFSCGHAIAGVELTDAPGKMMAGQLLQVFLALAITLATIWGLSKIVVKKRWNKGSEKQRIKIIDSVAVGTRDRIMLIEVDNQNIVVATTPGRIQSLHSFQKAPEEKIAEQTFKSALDVSQAETPVAEACR